jgi:predicted nucleic acid-binding protein
VTERYLLDTDVVSALAKRRPDAAVRDWVRAVPMDRLYLSEATIGEIAKGIARLQDAARQAALMSWLDDELLPGFEDRVLPVDRRVWRRWGLLTGEAMARGRPVPVLDALIAATALERGLSVVTRNTRDYLRLGAPTVDPWSARTR